jgi:hypothetical protein
MTELDTIKKSKLVELKAEGLNFHGFMINSILEGTKTHTCRKQPCNSNRNYKNRFYEGRLMYARETVYYHPETKQVEYAANFHIPWNDANALRKRGFIGVKTIYMRRELARIALILTDVYEKKVLDLTHQERIDEGIGVKNIDGYNNYFDYELHFFKYSEKTMSKEKASLMSFRSLWIKVNGIDSWKQNVPVYSMYFKPYIIIV